MSSIKRLSIIAVLAVGLFSVTTFAKAACSSGSPQLIIYHAGSLTAAFSAVESLFTQQTGVCITDVSAGSVDAARRITTGQEPCDIFGSADFEVIDQLLEPAGFADYDILFGKGGMVLAYTTNSKNAATIATGTFNPPTSVPNVADNWYEQLLQTGVLIVGSHPFLDPSGYRSHLIFQLANQLYQVPNLYDLLMDQYSITRPTDVLGQTYDYQFTYEHTALAAYKADTTGTYRYANLPDAVNLSNPSLNRQYQTATITIPGLGLPDTASTATIPGTRVVWGLTYSRAPPIPETLSSSSNFCSARKVSHCRQQWGPLRSVRPLSARRILSSCPVRCVRSCESSIEATVDYSLGHFNILRPIGALIAEIGDEQSRRHAQRIMATP